MRAFPFAQRTPVSWLATMTLIAAIFPQAALLQAANKTWTSPVTGSWTDAARWTGGVPVATDSATFNQSGTYTVNFSNVFQSLNNMSFSAGTVTFERVASPATLVIDNASGGQDLTVSAATLNLGQSLPVNITVADDTIISSNGLLAVNVGSFLNAQDVYLNTGGTVAVSTNADVTSTFGFIGSLAGSTGMAIVSGVGATWTNSNVFAVGNGGIGSLLIENGGQMVGNDDRISNVTGSMGTAAVTGADSIWSSNSLVVGRLGTGTLRIENGGRAISSSASIGDQLASVGNVTVTGAGSIWSVGPASIGLNLPVGNLGAGTLTVSDGGIVRVSGITNSGQVSINALSTLNIGEGGAAGVLQAGAIVNQGTLNFRHTDAVTIADTISGNGQIVKYNGAGDTTLADVSAFTGSFLVDESRMVLQGNANGSDYVASGGSTLRFSIGTVNLDLASIRAGAASAVEYLSATVRNGFLRGSGTHTILPGGATNFNAVTTFNSTNIIQNGTTSLLNFTNGGTLTSNDLLVIDGAVNSSTGVMNFNSTAVATDFGNNGVVTVNNGGALSNSSGNLINGGGSRTTINAGGTIDLLSGTTLELNGALLVNDGVINGTTNVNFGSLAKGSGQYGVVNITDGGVFSPGASPGQATLGSLGFSAGGRYLLEIGDAAGAAGGGYDTLVISGGLNITAGTTPNTKFTLSIASLDEFNQPGLADNFDPSQSYAFTLATTGAGVTGFAASKFTLDVSAFENDLAGGRFSLVESGNNLLLAFNPTFEADFDEDGDVDGDDLTRWRTNFGTGTTHLQGDADADADADGADFLTWQRQLGGPAIVASATAVPEPTTAILLLLGYATAGILTSRGGLHWKPFAES